MPDANAWCKCLIQMPDANAWCKCLMQIREFLNFEDSLCKCMMQSRLVVGKIRVKWLHCKPIPVMKTGFSLCTFSQKEKPVFITWELCSGPVLALYGIEVYVYHSLGEGALIWQLYYQTNSYDKTEIWKIINFIYHTWYHTWLPGNHNCFRTSRKARLRGDRLRVSIIKRF